MALQGPALAAPRAGSSTLGNPIAILIVGDETSAAMRIREDEVVRRVRRSMLEQGIPREVLPVLVYHMNKPTERAYCEKVLGIKRRDLLFVGLAHHQNMVVRRVLVRETQVKEVTRVVGGIFGQALAALSGSQDPTPPRPLPHRTPATPSPSPSPEPDSDLTMEPGVGDPDAMRIDEATMCHAVDGRGAPREKCSGFAPEEVFYVSARVFGLQEGTEIIASWYQGSRVLRQNRLIASRGGDFFVWFALHPDERWQGGPYRVVLKLNGKAKALVPFRVRD